MDIDRDLAVAERFGVRSIPTVLVLRAGNEIERLDGLIREADLAAAFERATHASVEQFPTFTGYDIVHTHPAILMCWYWSIW